jgi:serine protease Do
MRNKMSILITIFLAFFFSSCSSVPRVSIPNFTPATPLNIGASKNLEPIAFEKGVITLTRGTEIGTGGRTLNYGGDNITIDPKSTGPFCTYTSNKISWNTGSLQFSGSEGEFTEIFYNAMNSSGYDVIGDPKIIFEKEEEKGRATYKIGARIIDLKANICEMGHWWDGRPLGIYAGEAYMKVEWSIYSSLGRKTIARIKTEAYMKSEEAISGGFIAIILGAFENSVKELAANEEFYKLVSNDSLEREATRNAGEKIILSNTQPYTSGVSKNIDQILNATVTIRSGVGHGSGFVVDESGLLMTNAHVVGNADKVQIIFRSGIEVPGSVQRVNKHRDVALIKIDVGGLKQLPIRVTPLKESEEVYAVGTPVDEKLKATITKGIISSIRTQEKTGLQLIQSDVDIQGGNSGGPLLDNMGNIVGISVSGIGLRKLSAGLNFFIPIVDGLNWLNVKVHE